MRPMSCRLSMQVAFALLFIMGSARAVAQNQPSGPTDVILATTTSTQDSGLLDVLTPLFEVETGYHLKPIAVGSGAAMKLGEEGEADVLLVHSPRDEAAFVSRGDESGTHKLELSLWEAAGMTPEGGWYVESGTGMGDTLNLANEREGYTVTDRGTYLALRDRLDLVVLVEGDPLLLNLYHLIAVNPERYDTINGAGALAFIDFLLGPETQAVIGEVGLEEFGHPLFTPCANNACGVVPATPVATPRT